MASFHALLSLTLRKSVLIRSFSSLYSVQILENTDQKNTKTDTFPTVRCATEIKIMISTSSVK